MAAWVQLASVETPDSSVCVVLGTLHERYATAKRRHASPLVFLFDSLQVAQQFMMATQSPQTKDLSCAVVPDSSPPPTTHALLSRLVALAFSDSATDVQSRDFCPKSWPWAQRERAVCLNRCFYNQPHRRSTSPQQSYPWVRMVC